MDRLQEKYVNEVVPALTEKFGYKNVMQLPKIEKIIINMSVGESVGNPKALDSAVADLALITGQKPILTRAKKSLAAWKLRQGMPIGAKVTLRGTRMYQFLDKFMNVALPRVRDFRGISSKSFDGRGNYATGVDDSANLETMLLSHIDETRSVAESNERLKEKNRQLEELLNTALTRVGVVRFCAFENMGSDLSYAVALLDAHNNGVVMSSLFGREDSRSYVKPIQNGTSTYTLTAEEQQALREAMAKG